MQLISQGDIGSSALLVFLLIMLFASVYLFLSKAVTLSCRFCCDRKFLAGLARARTPRQVQALADRETTLRCFSRLAHRILTEKKALGAMGGAGRNKVGAMARRLIACDAVEQALALRQGLELLAAVAWLAPLTGAAAVGWRLAWRWLQAGATDGAGAEPWAEALMPMALGLLVAAIALLAWLCLAAANRLYLARFDAFRRLMLSILEEGGRVAEGQARAPRGLSGRQRLRLQGAEP